MKVSRRLFRALLGLYPARYRAEYGEEIVDALVARYERAGGSVFRRGVVLVTLTLDVLRSAAGVRLDGLAAVKIVTGVTGTARIEASGIVGRRRIATPGWALDARFVLRSLRRSPGYAFTAVTVLAVAVAAEGTVFSYVRGTLLVEPPYREPERVVAIWGSNPADGQLRDVISGPTFMDMERQAGSVAAMAAFHYDDTYLSSRDGPPEVVQALEITADFLDVLGVRPRLGRDFGDADRVSGGAATVLVSHGFWRDRLDSDRGVIGRTLEIEGEPATIVGVLPQGFEFVAPAPLYVPLHDDILEGDSRTNITYNVIGRLAGGATAADATFELSGIMAEAHRREQPAWSDWTVLVEPLQRATVSAVRPILWTLAATVVLVLLVALVNLATLFHTRTLARTDELNVRMALGAGWSRIARVLALETTLLATVGGATGLALVPFLLDRVARVVPLWIAIPESAARVPVLRAALDPVVLAIVFAGAVLGAVALTAPGFAALMRRPGRVAHGRRHTAGLRGVRLLVCVEVAVATLLCLGAGLTMRSAARLLSTDVGLEARNLLTLYFGDAWGEGSAAQIAYFRRVVEAVEAVPGVRSAATIDYVDFEAEDDFAGMDLLDRSLQRVAGVREEWRRIGPRLFETAGMPVRAGRSFGPADFAGEPRSAVVNEAFAAKHYPQGQALGRFITIHNEPYRNLEIVGIVADLRSLGPSAPAPPMLYVPWQGSRRGTQGLYVRVDGEPVSYAGAVRDAIGSVDPSQPVTGIQPMSELVDAWVAIPRATRTLVGAFAALAVLLSALGVFGVVAFAVRTRRSDLGVRLALGASPYRLELELLRAVLPIVATGLAIGVIAGIAAARGARAVLYGVSPLDPLAMSGALAAIACTAGLATYLPARRVRSIDPVAMIRTE